MSAIPAGRRSPPRDRRRRQCADRGHRHFRRAVHPGDHGSLEILCGPADQRRRHRRAAADEHLQIGQPGAGASRRRSASRRETGWRRPCGCSARRSSATTAVVRIPAVHQNRRRAQQQRAFERIDGAADVCDRRRHQEHVARRRPASGRRSGRSARGSNYECAERLSVGLWCPTCRGSCARRRDSAPAAPRPCARHVGAAAYR